MNNFNNAQQPYYAGAQSQVAQTTLIQRVSYLLSTALLVTAAAAWYADSIHLSMLLFWPLAIGTIVCVIGLSVARKTSALALIFLYALSVLEGLLMGPLLGTIARGYAMGATIIAEAAGLSALLVVGLGTYVWITGRDFGGLGKMLFWALLGLIVIGVIGIFAHYSPGFQLIYAIGGAAIFVGFTLYDFSNIKLRFGPDDYVNATAQLYLDFINLFWYLLQILLMLSGGGGRRSN
jgi:FtsH-binding integral membrane protein